MLGKYSPSQLAKSTAALITALVTFLGSFALFVGDVVPANWGWGAGLAVASSVLVRFAAYLTKSAPTLAQIEANIDDVIALVQKIKPEAINAPPAAQA